MTASSRSLVRLLLVTALASLATACASTTEEDDASSTENAIREDIDREPLVVRVPVRFTRNDVADVGAVFSSSWVPFTGVRRDVLDGYDWGMSAPASARKIMDWLAPDQPGAGYGTGFFRVEIPYETEGKLAYGLARVRLETEFMNTEMASSAVRVYSPLRLHRGGDQPCLSITMNGALEGKLKAVPIPFTDENFTERDWNVGDKDASGRPIEKVILATLNFAAFCWPENVEGSTHVSGGAAVPGVPVFAMVDKNAGQGGSDRAVIHVNLVENDRGQVSVGETFSTNGGILGERDRRKFDEAASAVRQTFQSGIDRANEELQNVGVVFP